MRVSFFVQAYNTEAFVGECLDSILSQRGPYAFDVLAIDDASTDGTAREIARAGRGRVRCIQHARNHGAIATANEGYGAVTGDAVVRVDSDDRLRPDFLRKTIPRLAEDPAVGLVYGDVATIDRHGQVTSAAGLVNRGDRPASGDEFFPLLLENFIPAPATLVRRAALAPLLPVPQGFRFLDWYLTTGIAERWRTCYVDEVLADYRVHAGNMHVAMVRDRTGEATSKQILDRLFANPSRRAEKAAWRRRVFASHYRVYADKYFGCGLDQEARRCYIRAIAHRPDLLFDGGIARRLGASLISRRMYEAAKTQLVRARTPDPCP